MLITDATDPVAESSFVAWDNDIKPVCKKILASGIDMERPEYITRLASTWDDALFQMGAFTTGYQTFFNKITDSAVGSFDETIIIPAWDEEVTRTVTKTRKVMKDFEETIEVPVTKYRDVEKQETIDVVVYDPVGTKKTICHVRTIQYFTYIKIIDTWICYWQHNICYESGAPDNPIEPPTPPNPENYIHVVFSHYTEAAEVSICYVAKYVPLVDGKFDMFEHIKNCFYALPEVVSFDHETSSIVQYFVYTLRCPINVWIDETTIDQIKVGNIYPSDKTCDGMGGYLPIYKFVKTTGIRSESYYLGASVGSYHNYVGSVFIENPTEENPYIESKDMGIYETPWDYYGNHRIVNIDITSNEKIMVYPPSNFETSDGDRVCHVHCIKEGWYAAK